MKKIIALLLLVSVLLVSCSKVPVDEESSKQETTQAEESQTQEETVKSLDEKTQKTLIDTAKYLTKAITASSKGFSADVKNPAERIVVPNNNDQNSVTTFIIMMMFYSNPEEKLNVDNTIYAKSIYMDKDKNYHINKSAVPVILKDVLGVAVYDESLKILEEQLSFKSDAKKNEYVSPLSFGAQYDWECSKILNVKIDADKKEIIVDYSAKNLFDFADGAKEEITKYNCTNIYSFELKSSNEYYLKLKSAEINDYIKTANPE